MSIGKTRLRLVYNFESLVWGFIILFCLVFKIFHNKKFFQILFVMSHKINLIWSEFIFKLLILLVFFLSIIFLHLFGVGLQACFE